MEDTLHELMTPELAIYWGLGESPRRSAVSNRENSRVAVAAFTAFLEHPFTTDRNDPHLPRHDRLQYVESWSARLKTFFDHFS
jgi:hypothetical protein